MNGDMPTDNRHALRRVARGRRKAALATCLAGAPYASLVTVALDHDLTPLLLLSGLADHTRNLAADARVSLLFDGTDGLPNPQTGPRVSLGGIAEPTGDDRLLRRFLALHPAAALYAGFADFGLWRVRPEKAHFVGGFARAVWFDAPFGLDPAVTRAMTEAEPGILAHMNDDHADAVAVLAGGGAGWRMVGIDVDGCDFARDDAVGRLAFDQPLAGPEDARTVLAALARHARGL